MAAQDGYQPEPTREEVDRMTGPLVLDFGAEWCPFCQAFAPRLRALLERFSEVRHVKVEDGPGRPLGRSFRVKLWPNLVFLRDGQVIQQLARPDIDEVAAALQALVRA
jgi:thioredoxin 1